MSFLRTFPGYMLAFTVAMIGVAMMMMAWVGWSMGINWYWALGALLLSLISGFNAYLVVGAFFFAREYLNWDQVQSLSFAAVGMMYLTPGIFRDINLLLTGQDPTGQV